MLNSPARYRKRRRQAALAGRRAVALAGRSRPDIRNIPVLGGIDDIEVVIGDFARRKSRSCAW